MSYSMYLFSLCGFLAFIAPVLVESVAVKEKNVESVHLFRRAVDPNQPTSTPPAATPGTITTLTTVPTNCTAHDNKTGECKNSTDNGLQIWPEWVDKNKGILERTMYVVIVITVIVVLYFIIKTIRLRRRKSKTRRYGVLSTAQDNMEMTPLDQDDDEEDNTVFEVNGHGRK